MLSSVRDTDIQLLRLFVAVAECGGFSAAQGRLNITQSTISTQMAKLEARLGYRLCQRGRSGFALTPKGEQILQACYRLFESLERFAHTAREQHSRLVGQLRIGVADNLMTHPDCRLPQAIARFRARDQAVDLHLEVLDPASFESQLLNQQLHCAISYFSQSHPGLQYQWVFAESEGVYCADRHPLFDRHEWQTGDYLQADWVTGRYGLSDAHYPLGYRSSASAEQVEAALLLILSGAHIGYLPDHFAQPWVAAGRLRYLRGVDRGTSHAFSLALRAGTGAGEVLQAFLEDFWAEHRTQLREG